MVKETRVFGGKTYKYVTHYFRKEDAKGAQSRLKRKGHSTRVTKARSGAHFIYHLWARPK